MELEDSRVFAQESDQLLDVVASLASQLMATNRLDQAEGLEGGAISVANREWKSFV
jgi:hypothetical protein